MGLHENSVGLSSTTLGKIIPLPAQANLTQQKAESLKCLALRTRDGRSKSSLSHGKSPYPPCSACALLVLHFTTQLIPDYVYAVISPDAVSSQLVTITTDISAGEIVCPGNEVIFTCVVRDTGIIAWTSDEYIGDRLEFNSRDMFGETRQGSIDPNTIATFVNSSIEEGSILVLVSQLRIIVSSISLTPSVTCIHDRDDIPDTFTFQVLGMSLVMFSFSYTRL